MDNDKRKIISSVSTSLILISTLILVLYAMGMTLGWFAENTDVGGEGMSTEIGGYLFPTLTLWTYETAQEAGTDGSASWVKWPESESEKGKNIEVIPATGLKTGEFSLKKLQFGTIDNLVRIKDDNTVYLRFTVTPEDAGDPFSIWIQTQTKEYEEGNVYPFTIYKTDATAVSQTDPVYENIRVIIEGSAVNNTNSENLENTENTENALNSQNSGDAAHLSDGETANTLFQYYYVMNAEKYDDPASFSSLFDNVQPSAHFTYTAETSAAYYVYVKITPHLSTFAKIAEPLTRARLMPCMLLYDFNIFYTVK